MQYDDNAEKYGYEGEMTPLKCDELKAYKGDVTIPVYGTIADADVYLKDKADEVIVTLRGANDEKTERIVELQKQVDELTQTREKLVGVKKSAEQILQNLLDCGLIKEWYFNGKFNVVIKADDPHLQNKELKAENAQLKKETEFMHSNCQWNAGDGCSKLLGEKLAIIDENVKLKQKLENVQASAYADSVDAGMRERRLKRAVWVARANRALEKIAWFKLWNASISTMNPEDGARQEFDKWKRNLGKFLKKAKEYK